MTTWRRRLRSRRWIRAWFKSRRGTRALIGFIIYALLLCVALISLSDTKHGQATGETFLILFAGIALVIGVLAVAPTRRSEKRELEERRHRRRVERSLLRLIELLEEQGTRDAEPPSE